MTDYRTVIAEYEALVETAKLLVGAIDNSPSNANMLDLSIDGDTARLRWVDESVWPDACDFPVSALALSDEQGPAFMRAYRDEQHQRKRVEAAEEMVRRAATKQAQERAELARLKAKYEGGAS